ncbi:MAG: hypothetical protein LBE91_20255 [Tannerella sp.]|jgi:hypothetical protein|nr:hypothetical protein [Tannerella sp.]
MKKFLKSRFFLTKVLPALFFGIFGLGYVYGVLFGKSGSGFTPGAMIVIAISTIVILNLYMRKYWISATIGAICALVFFYLIFAVFDEYSEFPNPGSAEALRLLAVGLLLCLSGLAVGILLMIPFRTATGEQNVNNQQ